MSLNGARSRLTTLILSLLLLLASSAALTAQTTEPSSKPQGATAADFRPITVFLVRHAEKADAPPRDPPLTEAGRRRAEALARLLGASGVKAVYTSQFLRTAQTGEAVAKRLGVAASAVPLSPNPSNPREISAQSTRELAAKVEAHAGEAVLVVGHSNSIPDLIRALGGDTVPTIDESKFDDLFVVTVYAPGRARVVHLKYGDTE
ncbi:MAG TPA: phosphoglycerate mutase family protein [Pyrinomonadaceae bacterium]|jgi:broad specificity phosphatase PhoE|nr:phosphoglycerate mutase family protein [Pyrinomonadaceae bacterium]